MAPELPELMLPAAGRWRNWLERDHDSSAGVWRVLGKEGGTVEPMGYAPTVEESLRFGWIDGARGGWDAAAVGPAET